MAGGNAIRGSRVGAGPMGEAERGETAPRKRVAFWCANGHESRPSFAAAELAFVNTSSRSSSFDAGGLANSIAAPPTSVATPTNAMTASIMGLTVNPPT